MYPNDKSIKVDVELILNDMKEKHQQILATDLDLSKGMNKTLMKDLMYLNEDDREDYFQTYKEHLLGLPQDVKTKIRKFLCNAETEMWLKDRPEMAIQIEALNAHLQSFDVF